MRSIPRPEHPKPQFERSDWINLNGEWEFSFDESLCGKEKGYEKRHFEGKITVPFCPESSLSGIGNTDFHNAVWYRRDIVIPNEWEGKRVILHFGACDYFTEVFVNGSSVGTHKGGYSSFSFDITEALSDKDNYITVYAKDDTRDPLQPSGKQSMLLGSHGCSYTRTTGIWQTVWLEAVGNTYLKKAKYYTNTDTCEISIHAFVQGNTEGTALRATVYYEGKKVGSALTELSGNHTVLDIALSEKHLWDIGKGCLYDIIFETASDGKIIDTVKSYFGLRTVEFKGNKFCLNGRSVFGRWVLDQGFYPDGIYTAPTDDALKNDIVYSVQLGFNGARLHEKIFEERFLYHADKMGYLVWGEYPNWGFEPTDMNPLNNMLSEWMEEVERDFNHPSIIGWCPFNETWDIIDRDGELDIPQCRELVETVYHITKALDPTRPVIDTSGNYHTVTDIFDVHNYNQDTKKFAEEHAKTSEGIICDSVSRSSKANRQKWRGEPLFVSEYGGIKWDTSGKGWGYGNAPESKDEFIDRYKKLTETLLQNKDIFALCYTQLYDVEQEVNGLLTYNRTFKFDPEIIKAINTQKAAIED